MSSGGLAVPFLVSSHVVSSGVSFSSCHAASSRVHASHPISSARLVFFFPSFIIRSVVRSSSCGLLGVCPIGTVGEPLGGAGAVSRFLIK